MNIVQGKVLILNSSYEPIGTISVKQAMCKLSRTDSTLNVVEWSELNTISSVNGAYPVPSVLRLNYQINLRKRRGQSQGKRDRIYMRDKFTCQYCSVKQGKKLAGGERFTRDLMTLDHIKPQSRGGLTSAENLVLACKPCNQTKGDKTPEEAKMPLLTSATLLKIRLETVVISNYSDICPEWKKYLFMNNEGDENLSHANDDFYGKSD